MSERAVKAAAAIVILTGVAVAIGARFMLSDDAAGIGRPRQPSLFYRTSGGATLNARGVFGVAHNAGDTPAAARTALLRGAHVLEIDVAAKHGKLIAAHDKPLPVLGLRAPSLEHVWNAAKGARAIEFDLKQTSPFFLEALFRFVRAHRGPQLIVASRSVETLKRVRREAPWAIRFLSVAYTYQLERLLVQSSLQGLVQGVTVRQDLLDEENVRGLKAQHLVVLAWVVNDWKRANELVGYGVDGVASDNLAIVESLGRAKPAALLRLGKAGVS